ncbi:MAG: type II secretion system ATPase GspE [Nitrospinota bacterium]
MGKKNVRELSEELGLPYIKTIEDEPKQELLSKLPIAYAKRYELLPIKSNETSVVVVTSNPVDIYPFDDLRILFKKEISLVLSDPMTVQIAINRHYAGSIDSAEQVMTEIHEDESLEAITLDLEEPKDILDMDDEAPIIHLINTLLHQAVKDRASDIHIEPFERELSVRYRIDGVLFNIITPPKQYQPLITSRVKVMAGLNIAEKRLPQDGRIRLKIAGKDVDVRASVIPTSFGERIVLRLLERNDEVLNLAEIGLDEGVLGQIHNLIYQSHGIILVTGPTGSGKTTTLYSALSEINSAEKNIITVEDPVEYQVQGIGQIQVNQKIGLTFASGLRSILRQDPDVIMIGEIRDTETAEIAINASLTGHLVFSTLHTNDSAGAITRLSDMGIEPFLISSSVMAVLAQRLVRVLCRHCRTPYIPSVEQWRELRLDSIPEGIQIYKNQGCAECKNTGYSGRSGIYELLFINDEIRKLINEKADSSIISKAALSNGMVSLKTDGVRKLKDGTTSIEELLRVTQNELAL